MEKENNQCEITFGSIIDEQHDINSILLVSSDYCLFHYENSIEIESIHNLLICIIEKQQILTNKLDKLSIKHSKYDI